MFETTNQMGIIQSSTSSEHVPTTPGALVEPRPFFDVAVASPSAVMRPERNMRLNCLASHGGVQQPNSRLDWKGLFLLVLDNFNEDSVTGGLDPMENVQTRIRFQTIKMDDVRNSHE